jgi:hypothetical protein
MTYTKRCLFQEIPLLLVPWICIAGIHVIFFEFVVISCAFISGTFHGTPTKRRVSKRQVSKRPVSKRLKRQVYKMSGLQNVRFTKWQVYKTSGLQNVRLKKNIHIYSVSVVGGNP